MRTLLILAIAAMPSVALAGGNTGRAAGFGGISSSCCSAIDYAGPMPRSGNVRYTTTSGSRVPLRAIKTHVWGAPSSGASYDGWTRTQVARDSNPWD